MCQLLHDTDGFITKDKRVIIEDYLLIHRFDVLDFSFVKSHLQRY